METGFAWAPWLLAAGLMLVSLLYVWRRHPRCNVAGPRVFPVVGCLPQMLWNGHRLYDWTTEELKKTPTMTMRVALPGMEWVETGDPANVEHILKTRFQDYPKGTFFGRFFTDLLGLGIFNADGRLWKVQRRVSSQEFHGAGSTLHESAARLVQRELTERLLPLLDRASDDAATSVDLQELLLRFTFDTICQLAFGTDPGCLTGVQSGTEASAFARAFDDAVVLSTSRVRSVLPPWRVKRFLNVGSERRLRRALATIDAFSFDLIRTRRAELQLAPGNSSSDLLSRFIVIADDVVASPEVQQRIAQDPRSRHANPPADLFLRDIVISLILAGRDTTACALTWFFWLLARNPRVEAALWNEIRSATDLSSDLPDLHYLHAALTESMRLYPPVPDDSKEAAVDDVFPDGTPIRKGLRVSFHMYAMGRSERIWGPDWSDFRPERFLDHHGVFVPPNPFSYPVFQAGPRICLGKDIAMTQMKMVAAALLSRYTFAVREGHHASHDWSITMKIVDGLPVHVKRRTPEGIS